MDATRRDFLAAIGALGPRRAILGIWLAARPDAHQRHPRPSDCVARLGRRLEGPPDRRPRSPGRGSFANACLAVDDRAAHSRGPIDSRAHQSQWEAGACGSRKRFTGEWTRVLRQEHRQLSMNRK